MFFFFIQMFFIMSNIFIWVYYEENYKNAIKFSFFLFFQSFTMILLICSNSGILFLRYYMVETNVEKLMAVICGMLSQVVCGKDLFPPELCC